MTPPRQSGLLRLLQLQPQHAIGILALLVGFALCALVANDLQRDYAQQYAAAAGKTDSLTQLLEEHARQTMRRVELSLSMAAQEVQTQAQGGGRVTVATGTSLRAFLPQDGLVVSFAVLDAKGMVVASTLTENLAELPNASDRDFYLAHQDPLQSGLFIGAAVKSRISGLWIIPVSIKLHGDYNGYLMGTVDPEYFQHLYRSIDTGDNGFVTLFTAQGWAVARWPFSSEITEHNWRDSALFKQHLSGAPVAGVGQMDAADGTPSVYSYRALQEYPLLVALGVSLDETLTPWRQRAALECAGLLLVLLLLGGFTVALIAQLRRRALAESALKLSEISVLKSSLPTLWIGPDARILGVNQAACDLHGFSEAQMLAMSIPDLNPNMEWQSWPAHWQRLRAARNLRFEALHRNSQGNEVPVEAELNFIEFEGREYNFAFLRDLTRRKQADAEIQRGAALLRGAIDAVDEAFVLFDAQDKLVYCNAKYAELYPELKDALVPGVGFEELVRMGAQRGLYRESLGREEAWITERLRAHREGNETRIQKRDDGRVLRVIDRKTPDGNIVGIRVDITEMVRATEEAQEASRYKSQFLANMSHEIRTPMNAILGLLTLLQNTELRPSQREYAVKTESAALSLLVLLNDILDFSKVEAGKMELDPQPFRLDRLLRDVAVILCSNIGANPIDVLFDIDAAIPAVVVGDSMRLKQVLVNLGGNAIKFTEVGQVVLRVRMQPESNASDSQQALVEFTMQDSGIGIEPDKQAHIFSGFSQAEASTTRRFGGSGLGLAICKRLVELMGGRLNLQSTLGLGSVFSFSLLLPTAANVPDDLVDVPRLSVEPQRVLIVDDNPVARDILSAITRSWFWPTSLASSGAQAMELLGAQGGDSACAFDVIYLDWQMPEMDGWETARQIRKRWPTAQHPRIVMLTSNGRDTLLRRTLQEQASVDGFLFKPVTASSLQGAALGSMEVDSRLPVLPRSSSRPLAGMRILVVEDNLINQQVAEELLNIEGALVSLAANGQLGVEAVAASEPAFDVVLMDIQMPVLDGYGATRKIREQLGLTELPIVAMTANAMTSDRLACLAAGMNEHVGKPFDMRHLVAVLLSVTGREVPLTLQLGDNNDTTHATDTTIPTSPRFSSPYLDVAGAVVRLSGLMSLYLDIAQDYIDMLEAVEGEFLSAVTGGDLPALVTQMHSLKGTSATLGAQALSDEAARLERLFRAPPPDLVALDQLPDLLDVVRATREATQLALQVLASVPDEDTVPDRLPAGPAERAAARTLLSEMSDLLGANNLAVLERFSLRKHALDAVPLERLRKIQEALQGLDLELAKRLCEAEIDSLLAD